MKFNLKTYVYFRIKHIIITTTSVQLLLILLLSCENSSTEKASYKIVLFYFVGDNNLSGEVSEKTVSLCHGWTSRPGDAVLVYSDNRGEPGRLYSIEGPAGQGSPKLLEEYDDNGSATAERISTVIADMQDNYPDSRYGLVVFSHATGWLPQGGLTVPRSTRTILNDDGDELDIPGFAAALPDGLFDYIVFEACFMAGVEVAWELKEKTPWIFASSAEILSPGFTDIYASKDAMGNLLDGDLSGFGKKVAAWYDSRQHEWQRSGTFSLIRTGALPPLRHFLLQQNSGDASLDGIQQFGRPGTGLNLFHDVGDYYGQVLRTDTKKAELSRLINACVLWKYNTPGFLMGKAMEGQGGFRINQHSGLTLYVPRTEYASLNEAHGRMRWISDPL